MSRDHRTHAKAKNISDEVNMIDTMTLWLIKLEDKRVN